MPVYPALECVVNVSEGRDNAVLSAICVAAGTSLLDVHTDVHHNRSVFTLAGPEVESDVRLMARTAINVINLAEHTGVHPRFGSVDVVPFVPLDGATMADAIRARNEFAAWMQTKLDIQCSLYGPERSLPDLRRELRSTSSENLRSGRCAVGARGFLIAYNLWLRDTSLDEARKIAVALRRTSPALRTLALALGDSVQVSCNLVEPLRLGPADVYDLVSARTHVARAELVGLIPAAVLANIPKGRWKKLDLGEDRVIEARFTH